MKTVDLVTTIQRTRPGNTGDSGPVVIAIVGYRSASDIGICLKALSQLTEKQFIVSICENGGLTSYNTLLNELSGVVEFTGAPPPLHDKRIVQACAGRLLPGGQPVQIYLAESNLGYAGGVNVSIVQLSSAERWSALWILNPDTQPFPHALTALIERARQGFSVVGSRLIFKSTQRIHCYGGRWRPTMASALSIGRNAPRDALPDIETIERAMNYVAGTSLFATREFVESVGLMDERYFLYCEEVDWCFRRGARQLGYAHESLVYHAHGTTIGSNNNRRGRSELSVYLDERNRHLFTRRFYPARYPLVLVTTLLFTLQYVKAGAFHNFLVALSGWLAGVRGEQGLPKRFAKTEA